MPRVGAAEEETLTTIDVLAALRRQWPVLLVGMVLTLIGAVLVWSRPGTYSSTVDVYFTAPPGPDDTTLGAESDELTALAGLVEAKLNFGVTAQKPVSPDVTISSMGVKDGTTITLPDVGGQFNDLYVDPFLRVAAAAPSEDEVVRLRDAQVDRISRTLDQVQEDEGVPAADRVLPRQVPDSPVVGYETGPRPRAVLALLALGTALTVSATTLVDRRRRRPRGRHRPVRPAERSETSGDERLVSHP